MEFLSALVLHIDGMAALAICTFRPDFVAPWKAPQVEGRELQRLPREAALHLVENVAGAGRMPDAVLEQVVLRADGIPLFIEELTATRCSASACWTTAVAASRMPAGPLPDSPYPPPCRTR